MTESNGLDPSDILSVLYNARSQYVSGEYLSQCLNISRTAVWKRINALKKEGYEIVASTKKGYCLTDSDLPYGKLAITKGLSTKVIGHNIEFHNEVDSTNSVLKQLASQGAPEGTVVIADSQTKGRGRLGRSWLSAPGKGIWMSLLLRPKLHPESIQVLTLAAAVAVTKALERFELPDTGIKWPNDILIKDKKVCGILTELSAEADRISWVIIGIGLNVNHLDFPEEIKDLATSVRAQTDPDKLFDRSTLASSIINNFEVIYNKFVEYGSGPVIEQWKQYNITLGKRVKLFSQDGAYIIGTATDIMPDGRLVIKKDDGVLEYILSGEISLREI